MTSEKEAVCPPPHNYLLHLLKKKKKRHAHKNISGYYYLILLQQVCFRFSAGLRLLVLLFVCFYGSRFLKTLNYTLYKTFITFHSDARVEILVILICSSVTDIAST